MNPSDLLSIAEVAEMHGVSRSSVYLAVQENRLQSLVVARKVVVKRSDAEKYEPRAYRDRPGIKGKGGRPKGSKNRLKDV